MKKLFFLFAVVALLGSCKEFEMPAPNGASGETPTGYIWPGHATPKPVEFLGKTQVSSGVYDYAFRMHLDGSQVDPNPLTLSSFSIPHVGPTGCAPSNGDVIYHNVDNDAQYYIDKIEGGWIYYRIRSTIGHTLKYNISKMPGAIPGWWFLKYGLLDDDGINNIITFVTN
ncbi:MAG: hypothetical protein PHP37_00290 [Patescibacteria group bacterium]|nr:hypothetical protein [Patescibacteria group bacterium]